GGAAARARHPARGAPDSPVRSEPVNAGGGSGPWPVTSCPLPVARYPLPVTRHPCRLPVRRRLSGYRAGLAGVTRVFRAAEAAQPDGKRETGNGEPATGYRLLATGSLLPTHTHQGLPDRQGRRA